MTTTVTRLLSEVTVIRWLLRYQKSLCPHFHPGSTVVMVISGVTILPSQVRSPSGCLVACAVTIVTVLSHCPLAIAIDDTTKHYNIRISLSFVRGGVGLRAIKMLEIP